MIRKITTEELRRMKDSEGLILQGCGGNLHEWVDGINDMLTEAGVLLNEARFKLENCMAFDCDGVTCLLFPFTNIDKYGAPTWYDWRIDHWSTKWDAYGYDEGTDYSKSKELRFLTAWSAPHPILQRLSEQYPALEITHQWADEDIGFNCGTAVYRAGEQTELEAMRNDDFANRIWEAYENADYPQKMEQQM